MPLKQQRDKNLRGPSQRQLRVSEAIRHALSDILVREDFFDPDLANIPITISEISISPDLSNARVYTMPLGGVKVERVLPALNRLAPLIQTLLAKRVQLRRVPRLKFFLDSSFDNAARMNSLLNSIN